MFKKIILAKIKLLSKWILVRYKPKIVGITGSVGKSSTKEAVYSVLSSKFNTRKSFKNYNNEAGVPLTIIGCQSPGRSFFGWLAVITKAFFLLIFKNKDYPEILILEMGVDKPGDMDYLLSMAKPDVGMITRIGDSHLEAFGQRSNIRKEKGKLIKNLNRGGLAIFNADCRDCLKLKSECDAKSLTFGFSKEADIWAGNLKFKYKDKKTAEGLLGLTYKLTYKGSTVPVVLPNVVGRPAVYASLAAVCAGIHFKMNLIDIANSLEIMASPKGRMSVIKGIKRTVIIDDTYNASPDSSLAAVEFLKDIGVGSGQKRIAVFGDMLELGRASQEGHRRVGESLFSAGFDMIVAVGERARDILRGAREAGMKDSSLFHFDRNSEAGKFVQKKMKEGDILLIKGSQGARMEQITKEIMAEPLRAGELLVRQDKEWR